MKKTYIAATLSGILLSTPINADEQTTLTPQEHEKVCSDISAELSKINEKLFHLLRCPWIYTEEYRKILYRDNESPIWFDEAYNQLRKITQQWE